jgi:hypothetical protein
MLEAGYSPNTAKTPSKLTSSLGFLELCEEGGLTDTFLLAALAEDIQNKKGARKAELELAFKLKGHLGHKEHTEVSLTKPLEISQEQRDMANAALDSLLEGCQTCCKQA